MLTKETDTYSRNGRTITLNYHRDNLLTRFAKETLKDRYLWAGENFQQMFGRVACVNSNDSEHAQRLYDYMSQLWFMPSTPVLSNSGHDKALPISCFLNEISDDLEGIFGTLNENNWLAARGGGIGTNWDNVREQNAPVGSKGKTSGIIPFVHMQDAATLGVSQGGLRRGSASAYLKIDHPEILEFIDMRRPTGDPNRRNLNIHHGVVITDEFMQAVKAGASWALRSRLNGEIVETVSARDLFQKLVVTRLETGEPYLWFVDNVNNARPDVYKLNGLFNSQSNLCVSGDTKILTDKGYQNISNLAGQDATIWNGNEWSKAAIFSTAKDQEIYRVTLSDGTYVDTTNYHKWYIKNSYTKESVETRTHDLKVGDKLEKFNLPVIQFEDETYEDFYTNGFFSGDGTYDGNGKELIWLYGEKRLLADKLMKHVSTYTENSGSNDRDALHFNCGALREKFWVPTNYSIKSRLEWFAGLCDADGTIARNGSNEQLQVGSIHFDFLNQVKLMLNTLGVSGKVTKSKDEGKSYLPDGKGGYDWFDTKACYRLLITSYDLYKLQSLGFRTNRLKISSVKPQRDAKQFIKVKSVTYLNRQDTYCFNEPLIHRGILNGVQTGNCSEISLTTGIDYNDKRRTAVCCLSSLNLEYFLEWENNPQFIEDVLYFLDNVMESFIQKTDGVTGFERARYSAMMERSVGLGVMGFHSWLQSKMIPFEGVMAKVWNKRMFANIREKAHAANLKIALDRGPCPDAKRVGVTKRFAHMLAIAPTASISVICGEASPGIEPFNANCYTQKTLSGRFFVKNKWLNALLKCKFVEQYEGDPFGSDYDKHEAIWVKKQWERIIEHKGTKGSVQHLEFLTELEKEVFKTAFEIDQNWIIELAGDRQAFIDQGQSLNIFLAANVNKKVLIDLHYKAWKLGIKGLYYCRSRSVQQAFNVAGAEEQKAHLMKDNTPEQVYLDVGEQVDFDIEDDDTCLACQ